MASAISAAPRRRQFAENRESGLALAAEGVALVTSAALSWFVSAIFVHPAWSLVTIGNYVWLCTYLFRLDPRATALALGALFGEAATLVSFVFIEYGARIPELDTVGSPGPHATSYFFYMLITYGTYVAAFRILVGSGRQPRTHPLTPFFDRWANWVAACVLGFAGLSALWLLARGSSTGFPLLSGTDRYFYRAHADTITVYLLNLKGIILFALGMIAFRLPAWKAWRVGAGITALFLLALYFLFGDKFFTQIGGLITFLSPFIYIHYRWVRRHLAVFAVGAVAALSAVSSVTWYIYSNEGSMTPAATMDRLSGRIVGQGELWYLQTRIGSPLLTWDGNFVSRNITALRVKQIGLYALHESLGPNYFSNRYAPNEIRRGMIRNGGSTTYTAALHPLGLAVLGWVGLAFLLCFVGILTAALRAYIAFAITSRSIISAVFATYVSINVGTGLAQGTPWSFLSIYALKWFAVIAALELGLYAIGYAQRRPSRSAVNEPGVGRAVRSGRK